MLGSENREVKEIEFLPSRIYGLGREVWMGQICNFNGVILQKHF